MNTKAIINPLPASAGNRNSTKNEPKVSDRQQLLPVSHKYVLQTAVSRRHDRMLPAGTSLRLAKWLKRSNLVSSVIYPGLNKVSGYSGDILKFSVRNRTFGFNLLRSFFSSGRVNGLAVQADHRQREFRVEIKSTDYEAIMEYFKRLLGHLEDELRYRKFLSRQIRIEKEVSKTFGLNISDFK